MAKGHDDSRVTPFSNLVIRASAGTGKTFQLSNRYLSLLERGVSPDRILATTFTRKAAGEILERIVQRLAKATQDDTERKKLREALGCQRLSRQRSCQLLQALLHNLHRLRICTLDSLFGQMARAFSLEFGLPPGWRIVDELEEATLRDAAIAAVLRQESTTELMRLTHLLTKGETRRSVGQLVRDTVEDLHGLFQETDAAAWHSLPKPKPLEAAEVAQLLADLRRLPLDKRAATARDKDCDRAEIGDWEEFLGAGLANKILAGELTFNRQPLPDEVVQLYERLLTQARAVLLTRMAWQTEGSYELLHKYDSARQELQAEHGGLRFDDITRRLDIALRRRPPAESADWREPSSDRQLPFRLDGQISHVLLDEFQDTSPRQWRVLSPFVKRASRDDGDSSFFCVGDVKQAIYGWRGGVAELFDAVEEQVPRLTRRGLATSFRSSAPVIETVNRVFAGIHQHPNLAPAADAVAKWRSQFELHATARTELPGYACLRTASAPTADESSQMAVEECAADLIRELVAASPDCTVGVLVRKNTTVAAMINALRRRGIRASEEGGNPLTDSAAVQLVMSLLRLGDHPGDRVARFHVATSPLAGAVNLLDFEDELAARRLSSQLRGELLTAGYGPAVERWVEAICDQVSTRDRTRLRQLVDQAYLYQSRATLRVDDFVRHVEMKRVADPSQSAIRVMTVHQAKGLEFDAVVVPELDSALAGQTPTFVIDRPEPTAPATRVCRYANAQIRQLLPAELQRPFEAYANQELAESLCVLYVALTRAAKALYLVIAPARDNEKSLPRSFAGLLRAALTEGRAAPERTVLYEYGDREWMRVTPRPAPVRQAELKAARMPAVDQPEAHSPRMLVKPAGARRRRLERLAPSDLEGGGSLRWTRDLTATRGAATLRGTVMHLWFQQIGWLEDGWPCDTELRRLGEAALREKGGNADLDGWLRDFHAMLQQPVTSSSLRRTAYPIAAGKRLAVETECPFAIQDDAKLLTGFIDRLVLAYEGSRIVSADILDFKTDQLATTDAAAWEARIEYYRPQLTAYRRAVSSLTSLPLECIGARLLFVTLDRVAELAHGTAF